MVDLRGNVYGNFLHSIYIIADPIPIECKSITDLFLASTNVRSSSSVVVKRQLSLREKPSV